jgi:hypothetical protein
MLGDADIGFTTSLEDALTVRIETLQEVLMGQMNPLERRLELAGRRQGIIFGAAENPVASSSLESESDESRSKEKPERESSGFETADNVEVEVESPSEDALRVANFLAEEHSDAESIVLSSEDSVEVRQESGGSFVVNVTEVLEREFGEDRDSETTASSAPSMSTAAAEKLG